MTLSRVRVSQLFTRFSHTVDLDIDEHITILHGPNGVGKTTVLRLIDGFFNRRFSYLRQTPFASMEMRLTDGRSVRLRRTVSDSTAGTNHRLSVALYKGRRRETEDYVIQLPGEREVPPSAVSDFLPWLERVASREWLDTRTSEILDFTSVLDRYADAFPSRRRPTTQPDWLTELISSVPVRIIETQRLSAVESRPRQYDVRGRPTATPTTVVRVLAENLARHIGAALASYAERSQELDRSFPNRLLEESRSLDAASDAAIRDRYQAQGDHRSRLIAAGLLEPGEEVVLRGDLTETERKVLWTYLGDVDNKLSVLDPIAEKVELFREVLNGKYVGKKVVVGRQSGFVVVTDDGDFLQPESLSSGEQHELVLAYRLLFDVQPGTLILIDEPEISLHVSWQQMFLPDLRRISRTARLDFLVATHSPTIIGHRWDLTRELSTED